MVHSLLHTLREKDFDCVGHYIQHPLHNIPLLLGEVTQHVTHLILRVSWPAYPNSHPCEFLGFQGSYDRVDAVMARCTSLTANSNPPWWKIHLIVNNQQVIFSDVEAREKITKGVSTAVDVGSGLGQHYLLTFYFSQAQQNQRAALRYLYPPAACHVVHANEAHVVAATGVLTTRVAQAYNEKHD